MPKIEFGEYTLVLRPSQRGKNPPHLIIYQDRMRQIAPLCAKETAHLKGEKRVIAFNNCIARKTKKRKLGE